MRRILLLVVTAVLYCHCLYAQQGRHGIGVDFVGSGMFSKPRSLGATVKYQYGLTNLFRIEPFFSYYFSDSNPTKNGYDSDKYPRITAGVNLHTIFYKGNRVWTYLLTGAAYTQMRYQPYIESYYIVINNTAVWSEPGKLELSENKFGGNIGLGVDFRASYNLNVTLQLGYNTTSKEFAGLGIVYNFKTK